MDLLAYHQRSPATLRCNSKLNYSKLRPTQVLSFPFRVQEENMRMASLQQNALEESFTTVSTASILPFWCPIARLDSP
eukprot:scaffold50669_cov26-Tisochrysis_lutea.AAC.4